MKKIFTKIFTVVFVIFMLAGIMNLSSCTNKNARKSDYLICKKENFEKIKSEIYKEDGYEYNEPGDMINSKALEKSENKLVKDKKYYLVFVFYLKDKENVLFDVDFEICDTTGIYYGEDAVTVNSVTHDTQSKVSMERSDSGDIYLEQSSLSWLRWNYTYVAVEFTPKYSGTFRAEAVMGKSEAMGLDRNNWDVCINASATVFDHASYAESASYATVSNLRYKRAAVDDVYEFSVDFDIDVSENSSSPGYVYCVVYMHYGDNANGPWDGVVINNADTAHFRELNCEYGKMLLFSYKTDSAKKTSAEIRLHFEDMENMEIDIFVTGDNVCIDGTTHETYKSN